MVRTPCCDKVGLNKGPWAAEEDRVLVAYIQAYGHGNWRTLPRKAGLLRCGKSCRLRWINYLRPDIKRGNFSADEEDTIIRLHRQLGNRWSTIAAQLPGRTDNEIKNVWHTYLKKRLPESTSMAAEQALSKPTPVRIVSSATTLKLIQQPLDGDVLSCIPQNLADHIDEPVSSSSWATGNGNGCPNELENLSSFNIPELLDDSFWSEVALSPHVKEQPAGRFVMAASKHASAVAGGKQVEMGPFNGPAPTTVDSKLSDGIVCGEGEDETHFWLRVLLDARNLPGF